MDERNSEYGKNVTSVKAAINKYRGMAGNNHGSNAVQNIQKGTSDSQKKLSKAPELHLAQNKSNQINEGTKMAEQVKSHAELELLKSKKLVKELTSQIAETKSKTKEQNRVKKIDDQHCLGATEIENPECVEVERELEIRKRELSKLKLDMARAREEKARVEKEAEAAHLRLMSCRSRVEKLGKEIEEANEEEVLVELAQIQARKELAAIEDQRKQDAKKFASLIEENRKRVDILKEEMEGVKEIEEKLAVTNSDLEVMQELKLIKEMEEKVASSAKFKDSDCTTDTEGAKTELESIKRGGFELTSSMDVIRNELMDILKEKSRMEDLEKQTEKMISNLNSKLLRALGELEVVGASEKNAELMLSSLYLALDRLEKEKEAALKEKAEIEDEKEKIRTEIQKTESETDSMEEKLSDAMEEIVAVKFAEAKALKKLKTLVEKTVTTRASKKKSTITISRFEYDYLTKHAVGAQEIADKKVAAANAWVEALNASEIEMKIRIASDERKIKELQIQEDQEICKMESFFNNVELDEQEPQTERKQGNNSFQSRRSIGENNYCLVPVRQAKFRRSMASSAAARRVSSSTYFTMKKRTTVMFRIAKYLVSKQSKSEKGITSRARR